MMSNEDTPVIITFPSSQGPVDLPARGIDEAGAANLRQRLAAFSEDWSRPEMEPYDAIHQDSPNRGEIR